ncbi:MULTISPECIES: hypothetical protein [Paenibacillus]|uniref:Uncharacterized protein n=1 Tax=Paenibacillus odorifer TaxID=189426 RepID=A0A1R0X1T5_9BACL|nr:hypothetical protein [Paenibacillus odorifer]OMD26762.1 hypothetical protein BJP51_26590 [Paenibacillus odorifer]
MSKKISDVLMQRNDISDFLVHLTKETEDGQSAKDNLISILNDMEIKAFNHHCYFSPRLHKEEQKIQNRFNVVCFTETPLDKIHLLTDISGRKVRLQPYGLVFPKISIEEAKGNPAFYVYNENQLLLDYLNTQYHSFITAYKEDGEVNNFQTLGSLVNIVRKGHDFHWEREWRVRKKFKFKINELFAIIAPEKEHNDIRNRVNLDDVEYFIFLDATWSMQTIIEKLSIYMWNELRG